MLKLSFKEFFENLKNGRLLGLKCNDCGDYTCPPKSVCDGCGGENLEIAELKGNGKIKTFTTTYVAPTGYEKNAPYVTAMVETEEGPWIVGRLNISPDEADRLSQNLLDRKVTIKYQELPPEPFYPDKQRVIVPLFDLD